MKEVQCPKCGEKKPYREDSMQICQKCGRFHMTMIGLPKPKFNLIEKLVNTKKESVEDDRTI